jgi:natural product precursor
MVTKATKQKARVKVGKLKLNKETIKELSKSEVKKVRGGVGHAQFSDICGMKRL